MKVTHNPKSITRRTFAICAALLTTFLTTSAFADDDAWYSRYGRNDWRADRGIVYVASNSTTGNQILTFNRSSTGALTPTGSVATGGTGTGTGLGNAGGLAMQENGPLLFAVNAGSNEISVLAATRSGLFLVDKQPSGGVRPVSVTVSDDLVYVLNAGGAGGSADNISGFKVGRNGRLSPIAGSSRPLSAASTGPAQIGFNPNGDVLLVTEKATNKLTTFTISQDGLATSQQSVASNGATPFGFAFAGRAKAFVSNAAGGAPGGSSVSSYFVDETGSTFNLANAVPTNRAAACWISITSNGKFGYVTNTGDSTLSIFNIGGVGSLTLAATVATGGLSGPIDNGISLGDRYLYVLNGTGAVRSISAYAIAADGSLTALAGAAGLPVGSNGLIAR